MTANLVILVAQKNKVVAVPSSAIIYQGNKQYIRLVDDPQKKTILSLFSNAYIRHPYKYPVIGYEKLLRSLTREDLLK